VADGVDLRTPDQLLQETCQTIVTAAAQAIDAEPASRTSSLRLPGGPVVGKQITIDATEKGGLLNMCRLAVLDPEVAPEGEVARIEYEHDKQTKFGAQRVYSIQSVRRKGGELVLLENFLAETPTTVREEDFRPIQSEKYAQETVLATLQEWTHFRAWQLQEMRKK
jgi:hypothetical protein